MKFSLFLLVLLCARTAGAIPSDGDLTLQQVLDSVRRHFPLIQGAEEEKQAALGAVTSSLGGFDLRWKSSFERTAPGYYDRNVLDSLIEKPISAGGIDIYGGYRQGVGSFALYDGKAETMNGGEARLGVQVPVLRDRAIDARRAELAIAETGVQIASQSVELKRIGAIRKASTVYWKWAGAGQKLSIIKDLLKIAQDRDRVLGERVAHGDIAEFERKDNMRTLLQREGQLRAAERALQEAAFELSLFFRNEEGVPIVPDERQKPKIISPIVKRKADSLEQLETQALRIRPEIQQLDQQKEQIAITEQHAENQLMPKLDLTLEVSKDMGTVDETRDPTELRSGIKLEVPLQRRRALGKQTEAQAKIRKLEREREFLVQSIRAELQDALSALRLSQEQLKIVETELAFARELEEGERQRFAAGESTILVVNLREQATADSALRQIDSLVAYHVAEAYLHAALGGA